MKKFTKFLFLFLVLISSLFAQEGMWLLNQIDKLDLKKKGLKIEVSQIYSKEKPALYQAIIQLGGGTASFVSSEGLIVTNHHVAFTALQRTSSAQNDHLTNGFLAKTKSEEIQAPGYTARILLEMKDVTKEINESAKDITDPIEINKAKRQKIVKLQDALKKDDIEANVSEMYNGKEYYLFVYKTFKDVRLVYSPPLSIGNYGGETDNWMWPRHTGDFSFMRVYVSPEGKGNEYSKENVPYKPKVWLKVAKENLKEGDFTFIMGFPGFTTRYRSSNSVDWNLNENYPFAINNFKEIIEIAETLTKNDKEGRIKVSNLIKGLANVMKNYEGKVSGMKKTNFLRKKLEFEKEFLKWANANPTRKEKYANLIEKEKEQYIALAKYKQRDNILGNISSFSGTELGIAFYLFGTIKEMEKPEKERQPGLDEAAINEIIENLQYNYADSYEPVDKALLIRSLKMAKDLPENQKIHQLDYILENKNQSIEQFVDEAYKNTKLKDIEVTKALFKKSSKEIEELNDPLINIAVRLYSLTQENQKASEKFNAEVTLIRKQYIDALYEWKGSSLYPDANSTLRFTSGIIKGYKPADAVWYYPFTTLKGVVEKNTGVEPFDAPKKLVDLYNQKDFGRWMDPKLNDVPVAFTHLCDITGGNSGSPVLNAKGEIIGLAFDGNYEAMISDWQYDIDLQRTISVSMNYVLFITEKFSNAGFLLKEMGL